MTVANVDESTKKGKSLGGRVLAPPFDVMDAGRMAVLQESDGRRVLSLAGGTQHRRPHPLRTRGALLDRADDARSTDGGSILHGSCWVAKHNAPGAPIESTPSSATTGSRSSA